MEYSTEAIKKQGKMDFCYIIRGKLENFGLHMLRGGGREPPHVNLPGDHCTLWNEITYREAKKLYGSFTFPFRNLDST